MASKISVPSDFGIENLDNPGVCDVTLYLQENQLLRVSSTVLSYNGSEFRRLFADLLLRSLQMDDFPVVVVRSFVEAMYCGSINVTRSHFRDVHKMSHIFGVEWILKRCDDFFENFCENLQEGSYEDFLYAVGEAVYAEQFTKRVKLRAIVITRCAKFSASQRNEFLKRYLENYVNLTDLQLKLMCDIENSGTLAADPIIALLLLDKLSSPDAVMDCKSMFLIRSLDLETYCSSQNEQKRSVFQSIFEVVVKVDGCSIDDLQYLLRLHQKSFSLYVNEVDLSVNKALIAPNLFRSWEPYMHDTPGLDALINGLLNSPSVCSLYMLIEGIVVGFLSRPYDFNEDSGKELIQRVAATMIERHWTELPGNFLKSLPYSGNRNISKLCEILRLSDLVIDRSSMAHSAVCVAVSDSTPTMWDFLTIPNTYNFHFEAVEFKKGTVLSSPPFQVTVIPVEFDEADEARFDIQLKFEGISHTHLHKEGTPLSGSIHLVLEEWCTFADQEWMNIGLLSWYGRPRYTHVKKNAYILFSGAGFFNPTYRAKMSRPVRLVAYYTVPFRTQECLLLESQKSMNEKSEKSRHHFPAI
ncbi:hypothetical protein ACHWQZ_G007899 [Mnemiopsis leidyi]